MCAYATLSGFLFLVVFAWDVYGLKFSLYYPHAFRQTHSSRTTSVSSSYVELFFFFAKLFILCRVNDLRALEVSRKKKFWLSVEVIAIKVIILSLAVFVL
jgi:hypothetical protein